jgi:hypothetical protein
MPLHIFIIVNWFLLQEEKNSKNYLKMHLKKIRKGKGNRNFLPS